MSWASRQFVGAGRGFSLRPSRAKAPELDAPNQVGAAGVVREGTGVSGGGVRADGRGQQRG